MEETMMTAETTHEGNALIIELMKHVLNPHDGGVTFTREDEYEIDGDEHYGNWHPIEILGSYDSLMEVLDKIQSIDNVSATILYLGRVDKIREHVVTISMYMGDNVTSQMGFGKDKHRVQAIYNCIVSFIKWTKENQ